MPTLPISTALEEASPHSISDLFSRDIESISDAEIDLIIQAMRENRERMAAAEAAGVKPPRAPRAPKEPELPAPARSGNRIGKLVL